MSATGTITSIGKASWGDNLKPCWRVYLNLDDPHALAETGPTRTYPSWCFELPRTSDVEPVAAGERIEVSTHGHRDVTVLRTPPVTLKSLAGVYDYNAAY